MQVTILLDSPELSYFRENVRRLCGNESQRAVARRAKISPEYLCLVLSGKRNPSLGIAANIARALSYPLASLLAEPRLFDADNLRQ